MRRCRRCGEYYASRFKKGKICDECKLPVGSGLVKEIRERKKKELMGKGITYKLRRK